MTADCAIRENTINNSKNRNILANNLIKVMV